jgi:methionyl-tRNA formyltransferase
MSKSSSLSIIFAGTPEFSASHLDALIQSEHQVLGVLTQPDRPKGRGRKLIPSPVKKLAELQNIPLFQPGSLFSEDTQSIIRGFGADIMVVVAYGIIIPERILKIPKLGCINVHGSLLPRWRGAAPIQRSILSGDTETGITVIQMDPGIDTGNILYQISCPISSEDSSAILYDRLAQLGQYALLETLSKLASSSITPRKQDNISTSYAKKLSKEEARIDWSLSAVHLKQCIKAFNPWPISYFNKSLEKVKVWDASTLPHTLRQPGEILWIDKSGIHVATGKGVLNLQNLQFPGRKAIKISSMLNSKPNYFRIGELLT